MNKTQLPEVRIKNARLLTEHVSVHLHELWGSGGEMVDDDKMEYIVDAYRKAWQPYEEKVLTGLIEVNGYTFRQNIIDVYIAPWFVAFSDPLVIGIASPPDEFIDVLSHELIHRLITDNTASPDDETLGQLWKDTFGHEHSFGCRVHIPVHAYLKALYLDVLDEPQRYERDKRLAVERDAVDYIAAWEYVDAHDYKDIIEQVKKDFTSTN